MPDLTEITTKVRKIIVDSPILEGMDPAGIQNDTPLAETLGLDSVDALEIVNGLEKLFEIKIDANGLDRKNFQSIDSLSSFVQDQIQASPQES